MLRAKGEKAFRVWNFRVAGFISGFVFQGWRSGFQSAASRAWGSKTPQCDAEKNTSRNKFRRCQNENQETKFRSLKNKLGPTPKWRAQKPCVLQRGIRWTATATGLWNLNALWTAEWFGQLFCQHHLRYKAVISHNKDTYPCYKPSSARRCIKHCSLCVFSLSSNQKVKSKVQSENHQKPGRKGTEKLLEANTARDNADHRTRVPPQD